MCIMGTIPICRIRHKMTIYPHPYLPAEEHSSSNPFSDPYGKTYPFGRNILSSMYLKHQKQCDIQKMLTDDHVDSEDFPLLSSSSKI